MRKCVRICVRVCVGEVLIIVAVQTWAIMPYPTHMFVSNMITGFN